MHHLQALRADVAHIRSEQVADLQEIKERLGHLEARHASISRRVGRVAGELERLNKRLDLSDAVV